MIASISLYNLTSYSLQIAILVGAGALLARVFRPRISTATLAYWQILLVACLLLPVSQPWKKSVAAPPMTVTQTVSGTHPAAAAQPEPAGATPATRTAWLIEETVLLLLGAGIALRAAWLALGLLSLRRFRRRSTLLSSEASPIGGAEQRLGVHAALYTSDKTTSPITFGLFRPVIILPHNVLEMDTQLQEAIVYHELLHVRRRDWIYEIVEEVIRAVFWFHPAIWWLIGRIQLSREQVVDRSVIQVTQSRDQYVEALLTVALAKSRIPLIPAPLFLRTRLLKKRVAEIFKESSMSKFRLVLCLAISSCLALLAVSAAVRIFPLERRSQDTNAEPVQVIKGSDHLIHGGPLEYPRRAMEKRIEGDVLLEISVNDQGEVSDARVLNGPEELRRAALESVLQWHYADTMPLPGTTQAVIRFRLPAEMPPAEVAFAYKATLASEETRDNLELQLKMIDRKLASQNNSAAEKADLELQVAKLENMMEVEIIESFTSAERAKRQMEEIHEALANRNVSTAERQQLELRLLEVSKAWYGIGRSSLEREMEQVKEQLADPRMPAEGRAKLKEHVDELRMKIRVSDGSGKLTRIRGERLSDSALNLLMSRLGVQVGEIVTEEVVRRVIEAAKDVDEHLRVVFHADGKGGIELVLLAP